MLGTSDAIATIAVRDIGKARDFYENKLGLKPSDDEAEPGVMTYRSGGTILFVYESQFAGTNRASAATWLVGDDIHAIVDALKARGVEFERYDFPGGVHEGDVHVTGAMRAAWCKDPDGNVLALVSG